MAMSYQEYPYDLRGWNGAAAGCTSVGVAIFFFLSFAAFFFGALS
jgi:hypothetical protein